MTPATRWWCVVGAFALYTSLIAIGSYSYVIPASYILCAALALIEGKPHDFAEPWIIASLLLAPMAFMIAILDHRGRGVFATLFIYALLITVTTIGGLWISQRT